MYTFFIDLYYLHMLSGFKFRWTQEGGQSPFQNIYVSTCKLYAHVYIL